MWDDLGVDAPLLTRSHVVAARLTASINGSSFTYPVSLVDGRVSVSASSNVRRALEATVLADADDPEVDALTTELQAEYGIRRVDGTVRWVIVGTFVITDAKEVGPGRVKVVGQDRWRRVQEARLLEPVVTSGSIVSAIISLVQGADSRIVCTDLTGSTATHRSSLWERDRDKAVVDLARAIGAQVVFAPDGTARIVPVPSPTAPAVLRLSGGDGGFLVSAARGTTRERTRNAAVAEGESQDSTPPVRGVALVGTGPLRYGGPFGRRPAYLRSSLMTTQAQVDAAAAALLSRVSGVVREVDVEALPHPGLDAWDVLDVEVAPGVYEKHVLDSFTLPLGRGSSALTLRSSMEEVEVQ